MYMVSISPIQIAAVNNEPFIIMNLLQESFELLWPTIPR